MWWYAGFIGRRELLVPSPYAKKLYSVPQTNAKSERVKPMYISELWPYSSENDSASSECPPSAILSPPA